MSENQVQVTITLSDPELKGEELLEAVKNLKSEANDIPGVEADLITIAEVPTGSKIPKTSGNFLIDTFKAVVKIKNIPNFIKTLSDRLIGKQKIKIKIEVEENKKTLDIEVGSAEEFLKIMPAIDEFVKKG